MLKHGLTSNSNNEIVMKCNRIGLYSITCVKLVENAPGERYQSVQKTTKPMSFRELRPLKPRPGPHRGPMAGPWTPRHLCPLSNNPLLPLLSIYLQIHFSVFIYQPARPTLK